jgi:hypothetical protein
MRGNIVLTASQSTDISKTAIDTQSQGIKLP